MFEIKVVSNKSCVTIKTEEGRNAFTLKSGGSVQITEEQMGKCAKSVQDLLSRNPAVITVNKVEGKEKEKVEEKKVEKSKNKVEEKKTLKTRVRPPRGR